MSRIFGNMLEYVEIYMIYIYISMTKRLSLLMSTYIRKIRAIISVEAIYLENIEINGKIYPRDR